MVRTKGNPKKATKEYVLNNVITTCTKKTFKQMVRLQLSTQNVIPKLPFSRLVREIVGQCGDYRLQYLALEALQEAAELYLVELFTDSQKVSAHARRVTVKPTDMKLVLDLRGLNDPASSYLGFH